MCGIAGFFDKTDIGRVPAGATLLRMLTALSCRGPDSAGIALWGPGDDGLIVRVKLGDGGDLEARRREVLRRARRATRVQASAVQGALLRLARREGGARGAGCRDRERGPRRRGREHGATARDREAGRRTGRPRRRVRRLHLDAAPTASGTRACRPRAAWTSPTPSRSGRTGRPTWPWSTTGTSPTTTGSAGSTSRRACASTRRTTPRSSASTWPGSSPPAARWTRRSGPRSRDLDGSFSYLAATADAFGFAKDPFA